MKYSVSLLAKGDESARRTIGDSAGISRPGHVFWLFGLSGAGKSTLAAALGVVLYREIGEWALRLDGDRLRAGLCEGLGFSDADRSENLRRAAHVARLGVESGLVVVASFITPREEQRRSVETILGADQVSFVFVDAALDVCRQRDVKGLYARAAAGRVAQMTGVSAGFEVPPAVTLHLRTDVEVPEESAEKLADFALRRLARPQPSK